MPNRIIKESICTSEKISSLSDFEFRLWVGLITMVDDAGRGDARAPIIKGQVFPLRERLSLRDIENALYSLAAKGCVSLYKVDGMPYFWFPTWSKHQRIRNVRPKYPAPEDADVVSPHPAADCGELPQIAADCGLNTIQSNPIRTPQIASAPQLAAEVCEECFERLWSAYPRKKGKNAVKSSTKHKLYDAGEDVVMSAIMRYRREIEEKRTDEQYVLHGSTFFNGRWQDYVVDSAKEDTPKSDDDWESY